MSVTESDIALWAQDHAACFEVDPLIEVGRNRRIHVGLTVSLYARLPLDARPRAERWAQAAEIRGRLRDMLESLAPPDGIPARMEIEPLRTVAFLVPEGNLQPEIAVSARVFHGKEYLVEVTAGEEKRIHAAARRLTAMGFRERHRPWLP